MKSYEELVRYKKRTIAYGVAGIAIIAFAAWYMIYASTNLFFQVKGKDLSRLAASLARQINPGEHAQIRTPDDMSSKNYQDITTTIESFQKDYPEVVSAYTMRITDGNASLIVSPPADYNRDGKLEGDMEVRDNVGTPYFHAPTPAMFGAAKGSASYDTDFTIDRWGTWLTACSPLKTFTGKIDGIACIDEDAADVISQLKKQKIVTGALALIITLVFSGMLIEFVSAKIELKTSKVSMGQREEALLHIVSAIEQTSLIAIQSFDLGGTIRTWNRASEEIFGISAKDAIGNDFVSLPERGLNAQIFKGDMEEIKKTRKPSPIREEIISGSGGQTRKLLAVMSPVIDCGELVEIVYIGVNTTRV